MTTCAGTDLRRWIRTLMPRPQARVNLVCLPHAGGSASFFRSWSDSLPLDIETHVVQYPGREDRLAEPSLRAMSDLADGVAAAVVPLLGRPTVLFGHSLGASLAYEVAVRCERAGHRPQLLIASSSPPPHRRPRKTFHLVSDDALAAELRREAATSTEVLDNAELLGVLLPTVRADYELIETYHPTSPIPVHTPVAVFRGALDPEMSELQARAWGEVNVSGSIRHHEAFEGGHFYLREHQEKVLTSLCRLMLGESTPTETALVGIFETVLGTRNIDLDANLFELGGNSLHATRAVSRINKVFGVRTSVRLLYSDSTVRAIARTIDELRTTVAS